MMKIEIARLVNALEESLYGQPWFGQPVKSLIEGIDPAIAFDKPGPNAHSPADLLYHMITWASFTRDRINQTPIKDMTAFEALDWRGIDPAKDTWANGMTAFFQVNNEILQQLAEKDDAFLSTKVDYRPYNFSHLINGLIQHNIYHAGQLAYAGKLLAGDS